MVQKNRDVLNKSLLLKYDKTCNRPDAFITRKDITTQDFNYFNEMIYGSDFSCCFLHLFLSKTQMPLKYI